MNRLRTVIEAKRRREKLLSVFLTAGYPTKESLPELLDVIEGAGADFVEVGVPFSDPMADGPTIQRSSEIALQNGINLSHVLEQVHQTRQLSEIPVVLMSYLNPIIAYGQERLLSDAKSAGIDGLIIPDLIPEEKSRVFNDADVAEVNFLISPNTQVSRVRKIDETTADFLYCVAVTGVTGTRQGVPTELIEFLKVVRPAVAKPLFVGFGISNPEDACEIANHADGVIVGSAVINLLDPSGKLEVDYRSVADLVGNLKSALKGV